MKMMLHVVADLQQVIDSKFEEKKTEFAIKHDIHEIRTVISDLRIELVNKLNDHFKWTLATMIAVAGIIIAVVKVV